jgi:uncharacterized protein (TIGR02246 family)
MNRLRRSVVASAVAAGAMVAAVVTGIGLSAASASRPVATVVPSTWPVPISPTPSPTPPVPTSSAPTSPDPTSSAPTSPDPTSPVPTSSVPTSPVPTPSPTCGATTTAPVRQPVNANADDDAKNEIKALLKKWADTLSVDEPSADAMSKLYAENAVLHPTLSAEVRTTRAAIKEYFEKDFLPKKPKLAEADIDRKQLEVKGDIAIDSGLYTFKDKDGKVLVKARYVFVYEKKCGGWIIIHHSSSKLP